MMITETTILWILGGLVAALTGLVAVIYKAVIRALDKQDARTDTIEDDLNTLDKEYTRTCQEFRDKFQSTDDKIKRQDEALHDRMNVLDSKLKGQGDFLSKRIEELKPRRQR